MDGDAIIPYKRSSRFVSYEPKLTKVYIMMQDGRERKVTLRIYKGSAEEDVEHFFESFEEFQKEMKRLGLWNETMDINTKVLELFKHFDATLQGTALTDWYEVIGGPQPTKTTWRDFKRLVAEYIMKKILPHDPWQQQTSYMKNREKPDGMSFKTWWKRFQTLDRYRMYMMDRVAMERISARRFTDYKNLWYYGSFTEYEKKHILVNKVPRQWKEEFDASALHMESSLAELVEYFERAEERERHRLLLRLLLQERRQIEGAPQNYNRFLTSRGGAINSNNFSRGGVISSSREGIITSREGKNNKDINEHYFPTANFNRGGYFKQDREGYHQQQQQYEQPQQFQQQYQQNQSPQQHVSQSAGRGFERGSQGGGNLGQRRAAPGVQQGLVQNQNKRMTGQQQNQKQPHFYQEADMEQHSRQQLLKANKATQVHNIDNYEEQEQEGYGVNYLINEWNEQLWLVAEESQAYQEEENEEFYACDQGLDSKEWF